MNYKGYAKAMFSKISAQMKVAFQSTKTIMSEFSTSLTGTIKFSRPFPLSSLIDLQNYGKYYKIRHI